MLSASRKFLLTTLSFVLIISGDALYTQEQLTRHPRKVTARNMEPNSSASPDINTASSPTPTPITTPSAKSVEFARLIGKLKTTPRTGWVRRGVPRYESVADHSWRVATLSLLLVGRDDGMDASKCIQMALVHDLAECMVGDIAPDDNVSKDDKEKMEHDAMEKIALILGQSCPNNEARQLVLDLFQEYERRETKEARAVKDLDLLDMIIQADEYEQAFGIDLSEFFQGTPVSRFRDSTIEAVAKEVHDQRQERIEREHKIPPKDPFALSKSDEAFVAEHAKASNLSEASVKQTIKALRDWEKSSSN
jgi:putative hydrolase of HD superfamily